MDKEQIYKPSNIIQSIKILKGNTRVSVICEPLWGIPFVLFNFYLSLYMKELGVTDKQFGYIIFIGFATGTVFSLFAGVITDKLGRKKTTLIFDLISWPLAMLLYFVANSFWLFVLATVVNAFVRIVTVSWNLMVIEDADNEQRVAAFNLLSIINIATGVIIPLAGILVNGYGVIIAERIFLAFAAISMAIMILLRNHYYKETCIGQQILAEHKASPVKVSLKNALPIKAAMAFKKKPLAIMVISVFILFNIYIPLGTFNSLYFAPYMTEVLKLSKSTISILGGVYSAVMFVVFVFIIPRISRFNITINMIVGLVIQAISLFLLIIIPAGSLIITIMSITLFAVGFGIFRPYIDSILAEVTEGRERAGIYSIVNTISCILTAFIGFISGSIYVFNPRLLYVVAILILLICSGILVYYFKVKVNAIEDIESTENL